MRGRRSKRAKPYRNGYSRSLEECLLGRTTAQRGVLVECFRRSETGAEGAREPGLVLRRWEAEW